MIGFEDVEAMWVEAGRIREALMSDRPLCRHDWRRALVATEIVFASHYYGASGDWEIVTPWDDQRTLELLRGVQRKLAGLRAPSKFGPGYDPEH